jgi:hypothetical protein
MSEDAYQQVNTNVNELLEHINLEKEEINNFLTRISQQTVDNPELNSEVEQEANHTDNSKSIDGELENGQILASESPKKEDVEEEKIPVAVGNDGNVEVNWLNEVIAKEMKDD